MATRSLTTHFVRLRSGHHKGRQRTLAEAAAESGGYDTRPLTGDAAFASDWYTSIADEVKEDIKDISDAISDLNAKHARRAKSAMGNDTRLEQEIDVLTTAVTTRLSRAGAKVKRLAAPGSGASDRIRLNMQRGLAAQLSKLSGEFRQAQRKYLKDIKAAKEATGFAAIGAGAARGGASAAAAAEVDEGFTDAQRLDVEEMEDVSMERDEEIQKIARSIQDLAEIFKELNTLVLDQGTVVDRIDYNMDLAVERVQAGNVHLEKAEKYQKSARPFYCMIVLFVIILVLIIIIIARKA